MPINKLNQLNIKNKTIINIALKAIILGLVIIFVIFPIFAKIKDTRDNIIMKRNEFDKKNTQSKTYSKLSQTLDDISPQLNILDNVFISHNRELEFITTLEGIAQKNNVQQTIKLGDLTKETAESFFIIPLELSISGSEINAFNYLLDLENLAYYINASSIYVLSIDSNKKPVVQPDENNQQSALPMQKIVNMHISAESYWKN